MLTRTLSCFAMLSAISLSAASAKSNFDGRWSVLIITNKGPCDRAYRYPVKIDSGNIGYAGQADFTVLGKVKSNGAATVSVKRRDQSANGSGKLSGDSGAGTWVDGEC